MAPGVRGGAHRLATGGLQAGQSQEAGSRLHIDARGGFEKFQTMGE